MTRLSLSTVPIQLAAIALAASGMALTAVGAKAQPYDAHDTDYGDSPATVGELTVTAPEKVGRSPIGAPIERVSTSRVVEYRDLDLDTAWGARALRARIRYAAREACDELDARFPITVDDAGACYRDAVHIGLVRASYVTGYDVAER